MIGSDLYKPLPGRPVRRQRRISASVIVAVGCTAMFGAGAYAMFKDGGSQGEPFAVGSIMPRQPAKTRTEAESVPPHADVASPAMVAAMSPPQNATVDSAAVTGSQTQMENGVMVIRATAFAGGTAPRRLPVPEPAPAKVVLKTPDPRLVEDTVSGPLPRIGRDGRRPADSYAAAPVASNGKPRVAILIGGMGLDRAATAEAERLLPSGVTFGFAPYGEALGEQVSQARAAGHEVILQMPMEDVVRTDRPFPYMLKVEGADNDTSLHWLMSRFAGYAGVGNYLGGRLLGDEGSLKPLLRDIAARGLYFIDDGTAPRSLAASLSQDIGLPSARADVVIDEKSDPASLLAALGRLETLARQRGFAMGAAAGRPATNAVIGRYLAEAAKRGIVITPISQIVGSGKPEVATQAAR